MAVCSAVSYTVREPRSQTPGQTQQCPETQISVLLCRPLGEQIKTHHQCLFMLFLQDFLGKGVFQLDFTFKVKKNRSNRETIRPRLKVGFVWKIDTSKYNNFICLHVISDGKTQN